MPWFEAKQGCRLADGREPEPGTIFQYPRNAGIQLVAQNKANWASPPHGPDLDPTRIDEVDWADIHGIGEATERTILSWAGDEGPETVEALLGDGADSLPGIGGETAERVRKYLEDL